MKLTPAMARIIVNTDRLHFSELGRPVHQALIREGAYAYDKVTGWATLTPKGNAVRDALQSLNRLGVTLT